MRIVGTRVLQRMPTLHLIVAKSVLVIYTGTSSGSGADRFDFIDVVVFSLVDIPSPRYRGVQHGSA